MYEIAIINPRTAPRKSRKKSGVRKVAKKRKMTAKQKKYFGPKKSRAKVAKRKTVAKRRRVSADKKRPAMGYMQGPKRIRRRKLNPRVSVRRRARRSNPRFSMSGITGQLIPAVYGAGGALVLDVALGYLPLPAVLKTGYARHATRIVGALGIGWLAGKFLRGKAAAVGQGALTVAMYGLLKDVVVQFAPPAISSKLGEYEEITVQGYMDPADTMGAYLSGQEGSGMEAVDLGGVGAYMQGTEY